MYRMYGIAIHPQYHANAGHASGLKVFQFVSSHLYNNFIQLI